MDHVWTYLEPFITPTLTAMSPLVAMLVAAWFRELILRSKARAAALETEVNSGAQSKGEAKLKAASESLRDAARGNLLLLTTQQQREKLVQTEVDRAKSRAPF